MKSVAFTAGIAVVALFMAFCSPAPLNAQVLTVEMHPPGGTPDPFPVGWAVINVPQGEVTMLAILPANTTVPEGPNAGTWVFEGWLADLAPPHRCPPVIVDGTPEEDPIELNDVRIVGDDVLAATEVDPATTSPVPICGSRLSSETGFRGFPGWINKTFQHTYFPVSQGVFRKLGPPLGPWQFYVAHHKTNMGLRPYDVVGVTIEPPGTGAKLRDYDPRPNPLVALAARIPRIDPSPAGTGNPGDTGNEDPSAGKPSRRGNTGPVTVR